MEMNFNGYEFNSNIDSHSAKRHSVDFENGKKILSENGSFILSVISVVLAVINLPFGLFMNLSTEILSKFINNGINHWIFALFVVTGIVITISVLCGVFSIVLFAKTKRTTLSCVGLALAIISFIVCAVCLTLSIVGIAAW